MKNLRWITITCGSLAWMALLISGTWSLAYREGYQAGRTDQLEREAKWKRNDEHDMGLCIPGTLKITGDGGWQCQY